MKHVQYKKLCSTMKISSVLRKDVFQYQGQWQEIREVKCLGRPAGSKLGY
jgi:hypothetical protein